MNPIRPTTPADTEALIRLATSTHMFKDLELQALREVLDDYHGGNSEGEHRCVTYDDGEILGFAYFAPAVMTLGSWTLWWIVVRPDRQGSGIGRELMAYVEQQVRAARGRVLFIETGSLPHYEPTREFYRRIGYDQHAELKDYYAEGDSMIVFRKSMA